jgi:hypothetical protein
MAKHIIIKGAQPDTKDQEREPVYLTITGHFPYAVKAEDFIETRQGFKEDAERVFIALKALPGGTFDQLLVLMLQDTASSLIVATDPAMSELEHYQRKAASDLYEACKEAYRLETIKGLDPTLRNAMKRELQRKLRDALAKARGESEGQDG